MQVLLPYIWALWRWRHVPGPLPLPLLGNMPAIVRAGGLHAFIMECSHTYGGANKTFKVEPAQICFACRHCMQRKECFAMCTTATRSPAVHSAHTCAGHSLQHSHPCGADCQS